MLIVRPLDVGQPLQQPALRDFHGPYSNNYPGRYLSVHRIRSKYLSITLDPGHYFSKHWMRVLPIAESPRGGFIPNTGARQRGSFLQAHYKVLTRTIYTNLHLKVRVVKLTKCVWANR